MKQLAAAALFALTLGASCAPKAPPLTGVPTRVPLPRLDIPAGHTRWVFDWRYEDPDMQARGEGAVRAAYPDSARLDLFLGGGLGSTASVLIGDELRAPAPDVVRKLIPPPPMLWATLGRLAVPALADTSARLEGDTLRADVGRGEVWRVTVAAGRLRRLERIDEGRVLQSVDRRDESRVRYYDATGRRSLELTVKRVDTNVVFDASIWTP